MKKDIYSDGDVFHLANKGFRTEKIITPNFNCLSGNYKSSLSYKLDSMYKRLVRKFIYTIIITEVILISLYISYYELF